MIIFSELKSIIYQIAHSQNPISLRILRLNNDNNNEDAAEQEQNEINLETFSNIR